ncbi:ATP-binding cassette domain-containing protein [Spiractinospora alimapuensis]|uniref:ATP-binding cassette domain-containing protein n=1 Tax=Spiractinospora alimapuensis TaxID=2820884 RepID=UPI001F2DAEED|nr:ATP-binding cassette domain-containing protein [Spiractinospora alimapuensis]QVQ54666.1 ATP-binding cassette domain-containing protein [Spiractinospora alimapuensis]
MDANDPVIHAVDVVKTYGARDGRRALDQFSLSVTPGTVHALLGPNGAGKTTAVRVLTTLLRFDTGRVTVAGCDAASAPERVRSRIGLAGQHAAVDDVITGRQNLEMFARLYHMRRRQARARTDELLERFGLEDAADRPVRHYSGGMRRRLDLAVSLIRSPRVLFLDEPTTGLDPRSRADVWQAVRELLDNGTTVLLTTQYLEEADQLAAMISVVQAGRVIAEGSPTELKRRVGAGRVHVEAADRADLPAIAGAVRHATGEDPDVNLEQMRVAVRAREGTRTLRAAVRALDDANVDVADIALHRPSLDDVFLSLTGQEERRTLGGVA